MIKSLSLEYGPQGIRFNSILPGITDTERTTMIYTHVAQKPEIPVESPLDFGMKHGLLRLKSGEVRGAELHVEEERDEAKD